MSCRGWKLPCSTSGSTDNLTIEVSDQDVSSKQATLRMHEAGALDGIDFLEPGDVDPDVEIHITLSVEGLRELAKAAMEAADELARRIADPIGLSCPHREGETVGEHFDRMMRQWHCRDALSREDGGSDRSRPAPGFSVGPSVRPGAFRLLGHGGVGTHDTYDDAVRRSWSLHDRWAQEDGGE